MLFVGMGKRDAYAFVSRFMLENADQNQTDLSTRDERDFVTTVRHGIVNANPKLRDDPTLFDRLARAYIEAKRMGLTQDKLLAEFLSLEIEVPGIYRQSVISKWLEKPAAPVDDRFKDLLDVLHKKLGQIQENR